MRASFDAGEICLLCVVGYPRARREDAFGASPILSLRYMYKETGIAKRDIQLSLLDERPIRGCSPFVGIFLVMPPTIYQRPSRHFCPPWCVTIHVCERSLSILESGESIPSSACTIVTSLTWTSRWRPCACRALLYAPAML